MSRLGSLEGHPLKYSPGMRAGTENKEKSLDKLYNGPETQGVTCQFALDNSTEADNQKSVFLWQSIGGWGETRRPGDRGSGP